MLISVILLVSMDVLPKATSADPVAVLLNYGALGIFLILLVTGQVRTKSEVENYKEQVEAQQRIIDAFTANITGQTLPALARSAQMLEQIPPGGGQIIDELRSLVTLLQEKNSGDTGHGQRKE